MTDPKDIDHNRPGVRTNTPQHNFGQEAEAEGPGESSAREGHIRQTGPGTAPPSVDVADPHPADEGNPYEAPEPGGDKAPHTVRADIGPNPDVAE